MPAVVLGADFHLKYSIGLGSGLLARGVEVGLVTRDHALEYGGDLAGQRAAIARGLPERPVALLPGRQRDPRGLPAAVRARAHLRARLAPPRAVHLQQRVVTDLRIPLAVGARPRRYALTIHDPSPHPGDQGAGRAGELLDRALLRGAGLVIVHAEALREELLERERFSAPVAVVPHGADAPDVQPLPDTPTLLFFGRMSHYKGLDVLLDAMPALWEELPAARLVVAGHGRPVEHPLLADPRVEFQYRHVPDGEVPGLYARASVVVLPYRQASQSGVGTNAKVYGRATVVSDLGGLPELVADGSGVTVAPERPDLLAAQLAELLRDPERLAAMGRRGAASLAAGVTWPTVAELTLEAYRSAGLWT